MKITSLESVEKMAVTMEGAKSAFKQVPVSAGDGAPNFVFRVFTMLPGGHTPYHAHPFEHVNYIIEGHGAAVNDKGEEAVLKKGDFALVLPGEVHQYKNLSSTESFVMICAVPKEYE